MAAIAETVGLLDAIEREKDASASPETPPKANASGNFALRLLAGVPGPDAITRGAMTIEECDTSFRV